MSICLATLLATSRKKQSRRRGSVRRLFGSSDEALNDCQLHDLVEANGELLAPVADAAVLLDSPDQPPDDILLAGGSRTEPGSRVRVDESPGVRFEVAPVQDAVDRSDELQRLNRELPACQQPSRSGNSRHWALV